MDSGDAVDWQKKCEELERELEIKDIGVAKALKEAEKRRSELEQVRQQVRELQSAPASRSGMFDRKL